jgi:hypothetical protein
MRFVQRAILFQFTDEVLQRFHHSSGAFFVKLATVIMVSFNTRQVHSSTRCEMWVTNGRPRVACILTVVQRRVGPPSQV